MTDDTDEFLARAVPVARRYMGEHFDEWSEGMRADFEGGDALALFDTILMCGAAEILPPKWALLAFEAGMQRAVERNSFDAGFGKPHGKGKHARKVLDDQQDGQPSQYGTVSS
jgi:hypothetical protein